MIIDIEIDRKTINTSKIHLRVTGENIFDIAVHTSGKEYLISYLSRHSRQFVSRGKLRSFMFYLFPTQYLL